MTKREAAIVSAYTGCLVGDFADMVKYAEEKLGYQLPDFALSNKWIVGQLGEVARKDFLEIEITD
jgi:hypothetical protein